MKKTILIMLLCLHNFIVVKGEDGSSIYNDNTDKTEIEIKNPPFQESTSISIDNESIFQFSTQFGYGNIFTSSSFMNGVFLGFFINWHDNDFSTIISFQTGLRGNIYFSSNFKIGAIYHLKTGLCLNLPTTARFKLWESDVSERRFDFVAGVNPNLFELSSPLFLINGVIGFTYQFNDIYYAHASYEHSFNQRFRVNEVNVGLGYRF